jgi:hypothetical protein
MALPSYQDFYKQAQDLSSQSASAAIPSQQSLDTAAARVRSRLESRQSGLNRAAQTSFAGSGNTGGYERSLNNINRVTQNEYATQLGDLERDFWNRQQEGAKTLAGLSSSAGGIASQQQGNELTYGLGQQNLAQQKYATDADTKIKNQSNLIDLLQAFGAFGNIETKSNVGRGNEFNQEFSDLISRVLGGVR